MSCNMSVDRVLQLAAAEQPEAARRPYDPFRADFFRGLRAWGWLLLTTAAVTINSVPQATAAAAQRPNILLIVSDDQGFNDVGYHNPEMRTPHLDGLARSGIELDCHYVQPQCTPTRVALLTGRYPSRFGLHCCEASNEQAFPIGTLTIASLLKSAGYATGMSGKWHLGSRPEWGPNHYGFDSSHGSLAGAVGMYDHRYRLDSPFAVTWHRDHEFFEEVGHVTDLVAKEGVRWIEQHADGDSPWFFYVPFHAVHAPLVEGDPRWHKLNAHIADFDRRLYAAAVSHMDHAIGRLLEALEQTGQRSNTLVLFTSDNGGQVNHGGNAYPPPDPKLTNFSSNLPFRGKKTEVYEGGYRVVALANWPGRLGPRKVTEPIHAVDWLPTLAGLVGQAIPADAGLDGRDVWPVLSGSKASLPSRPIYTVWGGTRRRESLRLGDWKILRNQGSEWELYDLGNDPSEQMNLADSQTQRVQELLELYQQQRSCDRA